MKNGRSLCCACLFGCVSSNIILDPKDNNYIIMITTFHGDCFYITKPKTKNSEGKGREEEESGWSRKMRSAAREIRFSPKS